MIEKNRDGRKIKIVGNQKLAEVGRTHGGNVIWSNGEISNEVMFAKNETSKIDPFETFARYFEDKNK